MGWVASHQDLATDPKTRRVARRLDVPAAQIIGHLHMLWWWAADHAADGDLTPFDRCDIAEACGWPGDSGEFVEALITCGRGEVPGFVAYRDGRLHIDGWTRIHPDGKVR